MSKVVIDAIPSPTGDTSITDDITKREAQNKADSLSKQQQFAIKLGNYGRGIFIEEPCSYVDKAEYSRTGFDPGLVIIFNQETFLNGYDERRGTRKDVEELIITLGRLKFNIDDKFIFNDLTKHQIKEEINKICAMNLSQHNCLICVFLSHGGENNTLAVHDDVIDAEDVYKPFASCATLNGKPKLFIFQACKVSPHNNDEIDKSTETKKLVCERTLHLHIPNDFLLVYSTLEGEVSFRDTEFGTWFIQELCRNFTAYGRRDDVLSLITRTTKCVSYNYCLEDEDNIRYKQMPIFISTLNKKFYLTKSVDRILLLHVLKENKYLKTRIEELSRRIDAICQLDENN